MGAQPPQAPVPEAPACRCLASMRLHPAGGDGKPLPPPTAWRPCQASTFTPEVAEVAAMGLAWTAAATGWRLLSMFCARLWALARSLFCNALPIWAKGLFAALPEDPVAMPANAFCADARSPLASADSMSLTPFWLFCQAPTAWLWLAQALLGPPIRIPMTYSFV